MSLIKLLCWPNRWARHLALTTPCLCLLFFSNCQAATPVFSDTVAEAEKLDLMAELTPLVKHRFAGMKVDGWRLSDEVYFGKTKVAGQRGIGFLIDKGEFAYAISSSMVSVVRRF